MFSSIFHLYLSTSLPSPTLYQLILYIILFNFIICCIVLHLSIFRIQQKYNLLTSKFLCCKTSYTHLSHSPLLHFLTSHIDYCYLLPQFYLENLLRNEHMFIRQVERKPSAVAMGTEMYACTLLGCYFGPFVARISIDVRYFLIILFHVYLIFFYER